MTERSVAEIVVAWLEHMGADVYQEVTVAGGVADIVARVGAETWIIEVKTSLSLALLVQAYERRRQCHRVYIAAPHSRNTRDVGELCKALGIGLLDVYQQDPYWRENWGSYGRARVEQIVDSQRWNRRPVALTAKLHPGHKTHARAGSIGACGRWTPFRDTCEQLAAQVKQHPGITLKDAVALVRHHYATNSGARSSLARWVVEGKVPGVRADGGRPLRLYPAVTP